MVAVFVLALIPFGVGAHDPVETGRKKALLCAPCHRLNGLSRYPGIPHLAGQKKDYLRAQIRAFPDTRPGTAPSEGTKGRTEGVMEHSAEGLTDADVDDLAAFYASLPCPKPETGSVGMVPPVVERCTRCHGVRGRNEYKNVPDLAGQRKQYLENQMRTLRDSGLVRNDPEMVRERSHPLMGPHALFLSDAEIAALAGYFAAKSCR